MRELERVLQSWMGIHKEGQLGWVPSQQLGLRPHGKAVGIISWVAGKIAGFPRPELVPSWPLAAVRQVLVGRHGRGSFEGADRRPRHVFWNARWLCWEDCRKQLSQHRTNTDEQEGTRQGVCMGGTGGVSASNRTKAGRDHSAPPWAARSLRDCTLWVHSWG